MTGKDILIYLTYNSTTVGITACKSSELTGQSDLIEKASSSQQKWREYIAGRNEWGFTASYIVMRAAPSTTNQIGGTLADMQKMGIKFGVTIRDVANTYSLSGSAFLQQVKQTYTVGNLIAGSFQFKGTGALT
jgi:predicted secreted protein